MKTSTVIGFSITLQPYLPDKTRHYVTVCREVEQPVIWSYPRKKYNCDRSAAARAARRFANILSGLPAFTGPAEPQP